jgi:YDG domain
MASTRTQMTWRQTFFLVFSIGALVASFAFAGGASAMTETASTAPSLVSDKADYAPGSSVTLTGANWGAQEAVHVRVDDNVGQTWQYNGDITADDAGNFTLKFQLADYFIAVYSVTATGSSGASATTSFTDAVNSTLFGKDNIEHLTAPTEEDLGSVGQAATAISLTCPRGTGLTAKATGLGNNTVNWGIAFLGAYADNAALSTRTTLSPSSGSFSSGNDSACIALSLNTSTLAAGTYHGQLRLAVDAGISTRDYFFKLTVTASSVNTTTAASNATAAYGDASVALSATLSPNTVNVGTVTFTVKSGSTTIGTVTSGAVSGGAASTSFPLSGVNAGTYTIEAAYSGGTGFNASNNSGQSPAPTLSVGKAATTTAVTCAAGPFTYNGSPHTPCSASVTGPGLSLSPAVSYSNNTDAGTATASASYAESANYFGSSDSEDFTIGKRNVTASITAANKTYDGTDDAAITGCSLEAESGNHGVVSPDTVGCLGSNGHFGSAAAGDGKTVTAGVVLTGSDKDNYQLTSASAATTANINKRNVTASITAANKTYDGTDDATITGCSLNAQSGNVGKIGSDDVGCSGLNGKFDNKNAGTNKPVTADVALTGDDKDNYQLTAGTAATTANINKKALTVTGITANNKLWDGSTSATLNTSGAILNGVVSGEDVSLDTSGATGAFASSNVGTWTVQISGLALSGTDKDNYTLTQPTTTASITAWNAQSYGFYQPVGVSNSIFVAAPGTAPATKPSGMDWNSVKGGSTVPLKFNVYAGSLEKTSLADIKSFQTAKLAACAESTLEEPVEILSTGSTSLRYDTTGLQWVQNWQTPRVTGDTCYRATVTFADNSSLSAFFKLRK